MDYDQKFDKIRNFLEQKLEESGAEGYVLGISGGIDSATTAKTIVEALGPDKLVGWVMPGKPSREKNVEDARQLAEELGIEYREVDISPVVERFCEDAPFELDREARGNVRARARMIYQYMDANQNNRMVVGAGNKSEAMLGYFTKYGDGAVDVSPLADMYKTEVREFAEYLGLDSKFIEKEPTAGLWEGQTDQAEISYSYEEIDPVLKRLFEEGLSVEEAVDSGHERDLVDRVMELYRRSEHKRSRPPYPDLR